MTDLSAARIAVIGLGYVGLPLAVAFAEKYPVMGFDINPQRIDELTRGHDRTLEVPDEELHGARNLEFTGDAERLRTATIFIVTVPTPIDEHKRPDLGPVLAASRTIGRALKMSDTVIYESTVYPGATEEECIPLLEASSDLKCDVDFSVGYSPERINPGDRVRRVTDIIKVTSGSNPRSAAFIDALYRSVIPAGTHMAPSIKVAEAAKVIENTQRDVNIALMNELAILFNKLNIDTNHVLDAAGTKWNFLPFRPGLVGGHCIGVDPYYLTHKAQAVGHNPEIILAGRRINDSMGSYVVTQLVKLMTKAGIHVHGSRVLILGLTFKENTPDIRNSRVMDIIQALHEYGVHVDVYDPWVDAEQLTNLENVNLVDQPSSDSYQGVVLAVAHRQFVEMGASLKRFLTQDGIFYDIKSVLQKSETDGRL
jgi:UDP-N-acetyl-D-galactosamine dehydrogenase